MIPRNAAGPTDVPMTAARVRYGREIVAECRCLWRRSAARERTAVVMTDAAVQIAGAGKTEGSSLDVRGRGRPPAAPRRRATHSRGSLSSRSATT